MKKLVVALLFGSVFCYTSCSGSKDESVDPAPVPATCNGVAISFAGNVNPIISTKCATNSGCHGEGSANGPGPLTSYELIKAAAGSIRSAVVAGRMPKNGSLTNAQIATIKCWVDNGTPN